MSSKYSNASCASDSPQRTAPTRDTGSSRQGEPRERLLHVFPSFAVGGVPLRMVSILNHFGPRFSHTIITLDGRIEAATHFTPDLDVRLLPAPRNGGGPLRSVMH